MYKEHFTPFMTSLEKKKVLKLQMLSVKISFFLSRSSDLKTDFA